MAQYFIVNFIPLMILLGLIAMMYINRDAHIPSAHLFAGCVVIMVAIMALSFLNTYSDVSGLSPEKAARVIRIHTLASTLNYILRPLLILFEILIMLNNKKYQLLCSIPAVINGLIYSMTLFGWHLAFHIGEQNNWIGGPLHVTIYITQIFYLILLLIISINSFHRKNRKKAILLLAIAFQAVMVAILEYNNVTPSPTEAITALCILEYYVYLATVHRQELNDKLDKYVDKVETTSQRLQTLTNEVIMAFANAIDAKDTYTHGHSSRVAEYSRRLAAMNGKSELECEQIYYAGLLHDIGKIGVPESIITKDGKLTDEEYEKIKQHPSLGGQILGSISEYPYLSVGALGHHERYDGKGYPNGLKGEEIPEIARIIAVADAYDAMTSTRSYREPIPQQKVREQIVMGTGTQFDPVYARLMLHLIDEDLEYTMSQRENVRENDRNQGLVIEQYRSKVSEGILLTPRMTTIRLSMKSDIGKGRIPSPALILFDSLDSKVHTEPKKIKDLNYFEYGEILPDLQAITRGARKILSRIDETDSTTIHKNSEYIIEAVRIKDHALIRIFGKNRSTEITVALPDSSRFLYLGLTGEHCRYLQIDTEQAEEDSPEDYIPRILDAISYIDGPAGDIPNVQVDGYRTAHSKGILLSNGLKIRFHAKCLPTARLVWHCPFIDIFCSDSGEVDDESYRDLAFSRFDGEFWECDPNCSARLNSQKTNTFEGWEAWLEFNREGFDTEVSFEFTDDSITIITENAGIAIRNKVLYTDINQPIYVALTGDQVALTNIRIEQG